MSNSNFLELERKIIDFKKNIKPETVNFLINDRMLSAEIIDAFNIGENGSRISIPVRDSDGLYADVREYLPPNKRRKKAQKILSLKGGNGTPKLYPQEIFTLLEMKQKRQYDENCNTTENLEKVDIVDPLEKIYLSIKDWTLVLLVEGEMDALAAISQGFLAITNTCGANVWKDDFSEQLTAIEIPIIITLDADIAGIEGTTIRGESLLSYDVDARFVEWSTETPVAYDVTDELKKNGPSGLMRIIGTSKKYREVISLDEVMPTSIDWLFEKYIAKSKTTLIEGHPGTGKTFLILWIAAAVTRGGKHFQNQSLFEAANVLLMSAEDGLEDTIRPRIEKMDADLSKVLVPKDLFTLDDDGFEKLKNLIKKYQPGLVIIDPLMPFLEGKKDSNKASDMRPFFKKLSQFANEFGCAIIVTRHLSKSNEQKGITKGLGSIDISAAVRSILQVCEDDKDKGLKKVLHVKSNIGMKAKPFGYRLDEGIFHFMGELEDTVEDTEEELASELERACEFLEDALKDGPMHALEVLKEAKNAGISKQTLTRAKKKVRIRSKRATDSGSTMVWNWSLPNHSPTIKSDVKGSQDSQESQPIRTIHFNDPESYKDEEL